MLPVQLSDLGYVQVQERSVSVRIPRRQQSYQVGQRLLLIQKNQNYFVAMTRDDDTNPALIAVRRQLGGQGTAWVTAQNDLIFGTPTPSETGLFYLRPTEVLPILRETDEEYLVLCERNELEFALAIPKSTPGLGRVDELPGTLAERVRQRDLMENRVVLEETEYAQSDRFAGEDPLSLDPLSRVRGALESESPVRSSMASTVPPVRIASVSRPTPAEPAPVVAVAPRSQTVRTPFPPPTEQARTPAVATPTPPVQTAAATRAPPTPVADESPAREPTAEIAASTTVPTPALEAETVVRPPAENPYPAPDAVAVAESTPDTPATPTDPAPAQVADVEPAADDPPRMLAANRASDNETDTAATAEPLDAQPAPTGVAQAAIRILALMAGLTLVFLVAIFILAKIVNRNPRARLVKPADKSSSDSHEPASAPPPPLPSPAPTPPTLSEDIPPSEDIRRPAFAESSKSGSFSGSLDGFHISELIQFLHSTQETGILSISGKNGPDSCRLKFSDGEIHEAGDGPLTGVEAVRRILTLQSGFFVFARQDSPTYKRQIQQSTISLLMEIHQDRDETQAATEMPAEEPTEQPTKQSGAEADPPPAPKGMPMPPPEPMPEPATLKLSSEREVAMALKHSLEHLPDDVELFKRA